MKTRIFAAFLSLVLSAGVLFVGCADKEENPATTTVAVTTTGEEETTTVVTEATKDPKLVYELPETENLGGTFVVCNYYSDTKLFTSTMFSYDAPSADTIEQALYQRSLILEDNYGVELIESSGASATQYENAKNAMATNLDSFDVGMLNSNVSKLAIDGLCADFFEVENIHLEKAWWDQSANEQLRMGSHLYYTYSDADFTHFDSVRCIFFNKLLAAESSLPDIYKLVESGGWTLDKMAELGETIYSDKNGNGSSNGTDPEDIYCFIGVPSTSLSAMLSGTDASYLSLDEDGHPYANFTTEHFLEAYGKILSVVFADNFFYQGTKKNVDATAFFAGGKGLFLLTTMVNSSSLRREMSNNYGIIPLPKYNSEQKNYICNAPNPYAFMIPYNHPDTARVGFLLEALSYHSSLILRPAYFDIMLKGKNATDQESSDMLDIIFSNLAYNIPLDSDVAYSSEINKMMQANNKNIKSYVDSVTLAINEDIAEYVKKMAD